MNNRGRTKFKSSPIGSPRVPSEVEASRGPIPEDWEVVLLGTKYEIITGKGIPVAERLQCGKYEVIGANGVIGYSDRFLLDGEYIFTGRVGTLGELLFKEGKVYPSDNVLCIFSRDKNNLKYLYYYLKTFDFSALNVGSTQPLITQSSVKRASILLPPIKEQRRIAEILSSLDDKIELNRKMNKTLESIAQAIFKRWLVEFEFPDENGKPYKSSGGMMVDSELEEVPDGWLLKPLETVFDFLEGPGIRNWQYSDEGTRFINIRLINNGDIDVISANRINQKDVDEKYQHFLLREKDMVVSTSGTLGKNAIVRKSHLPLLLNTSVIRFRPKDGINYPFMYQYLKSGYFLEEQKALAGGSVQDNFGPTHLKQMRVLCPSSSVLEKFNQIGNEIYGKIIDTYSEIEALSQIRDLLLPRLMSGRVRV